MESRQINEYGIALLLTLLVAIPNSSRAQSYAGVERSGDGRMPNIWGDILQKPSAVDVELKRVHPTDGVEGETLSKGRVQQFLLNEGSNVRRANLTSLLLASSVVFLEPRVAYVERDIGLRQNSEEEFIVGIEAATTIRWAEISIDLQVSRTRASAINPVLGIMDKTRSVNVSVTAEVQHALGYKDVKWNVGAYYLNDERHSGMMAQRQTVLSTGVIYGF